MQLHQTKKRKAPRKGVYLLGVGAAARELGCTRQHLRSVIAGRRNSRRITQSHIYRELIRHNEERGKA